jgi:hypothetical protein
MKMRPHRRSRYFLRSTPSGTASGSATQVSLDRGDGIADLIDGALEILARNAEPFGPVANLVLLAHRDARAVLRAAKAGIVGHARSPVLPEKRLRFRFAPDFPITAAERLADVLVWDAIAGFDS